MRTYKRKLRRSQHELQLSEMNLMAEWSTCFYSGFDMLVEVVKEKFPGVDLLGLKAEDYANEVGAEVGSLLDSEAPDAELEGLTMKLQLRGRELVGLSSFLCLPIHPRRF